MSCEAAESIEDALLRMARVNGNDLYYSRRVQQIHAPCGCNCFLGLQFTRTFL